MMKKSQNRCREIWLGTIPSSIWTSLNRMKDSLKKQKNNDDNKYKTNTKYQKTHKTDLAKLIYSNDEKITKQMQRNLAWNHTIFNLDEFEPDERFIEETEKVLYSNHSYKLANYYR